MNNDLYEQLIQLKNRTIAVFEKTLNHKKNLSKSIGKDSLKLNTIMNYQNQMITLFIGEKRFCTTIATLSKYQSIFIQYLPTISLNDTIVIDRPCDLFDYILQFMREETIDIKDINTQTRLDLLKEAIFFDFAIMIDLLQAYINKPRIIDILFYVNLTYGSKNIFDISNDYNNSSKGFVVGGLIIFELEYNCEINTIKIRGYKDTINNWNSNRGENSSIEISIDKSTWSYIGKIPFGFGNEIKTIQFNKTKAKYIRINSNTYTGIGIGYFEVLNK